MIFFCKNHTPFNQRNFLGNNVIVNLPNKNFLNILLEFYGGILKTYMCAT